MNSHDSLLTFTPCESAKCCNLVTCLLMDGPDDVGTSQVKNYLVLQRIKPRELSCESNDGWAFAQDLMDETLLPFPRSPRLF
jgi:hypothetical protein